MGCGSQALGVKVCTQCSSVRFVPDEGCCRMCRLGGSHWAAETEKHGEAALGLTCKQCTQDQEL